MTIKISRMTRDHVEKVIELELLITGNSSIYDVIEECVFGNSVVCMDQTTIIGFLAVVKSDYYDSRSGHSYRGFEIASLVIRKRFRRMGIGTGLMQKFISDMPMHRIEVEFCVEPDEYLSDFYIRCGFCIRDLEKDAAGMLTYYMGYSLPDPSEVTRIDGRAILRRTGERILVPERY